MLLEVMSTVSVIAGLCAEAMVKLEIQSCIDKRFKW